ncbi:hypothetical protein NL676_036481 [Syzygium grande]|nr:hypothetical protein NL676_036481 [Syzygium grande]
MAAFGYNTAWRVILSVLFSISSDLRSGVLGARQVPCYFIFGNSLSDNGNNNDLETQAKANYPPYGIDFPEGVIGRFTNGRTAVDIVVISTFGTNGSLCVDKINSAVLLFNNRLKPLVDELNCNLADAKFTYIDFFGMSMAGLPALRLVSSACCKVRDDMCIPFETPCRIRLLHAFYDGFHPTEMVNLMFGARAYKALPYSDFYPFDIHHLAML